MWDASAAGLVGCAGTAHAHVWMNGLCNRDVSLLCQGSFKSEGLMLFSTYSACGGVLLLEVQ
jgi:hypothetical protein